MAMRMAEAPTGGNRIAMAVLAAVLAGVGGGLVAVVAWPLLTSEQTCADDATELCHLALGMVFYVVGFWLVLTWLAYAFRLGWLFVSMVVVGQLVCLQLTVELVSFWPLVLLLLIVPLGAWLSSPESLARPGRATYGRVPDEVVTLPRRRQRILIGVCGLLLAQWAVWLWRLVA